MKFKIIYITIAFLITLPVYPQKTSGFHADLGLTQNHKGFLKLFNGVLDAGAGYNQELVKNLFAGLHFRMSFLNRQGTANRAVTYKPGLNFHYSIDLSERVALIPVAGFGYSFLNLSDREFDCSETQSGWNPTGEIRVMWKRGKKTDFYLFGRFDYMYLNEDEGFTRLEYYRNIFLTSFGLGIWIKSGGS